MIKADNGIVAGRCRRQQFASRIGRNQTAETANRAAKRSVDKQQYFLAAAFVPLVGSSMCFAVMFWL